MGRASRKKLTESAPREVAALGSVASGKEALREVVESYPLLSKEEALELGRKVQDGDYEALEKLARGNLRLVLHIAEKMSSKTPMPLEDLFQEGVFGLYRAAERFDPERGYTFSTYAWKWIAQNIQRAIDNQERLIRLPVHVREEIRKVRRAESKFEQEHQRLPRPEELAELLEWDLDKVHKVLRAEKSVVQIESVFRDREDSPVSDLIEDKKSQDPAETAILSEYKRELLRALESLPEKERAVVLLLSQDLSLRECGEILDLSAERVRQLRNKAFGSLREDYPGLRGFLEAVS